MERMDEVRLIEALMTIASAFAEERDIERIADALETLADCVRQDVHGIPYFNISPEANDG